MLGKIAGDQATHSFIDHNTDFHLYPMGNRTFWGLYAGETYNHICILRSFRLIFWIKNWIGKENVTTENCTGHYRSVAWR